MSRQVLLIDDDDMVREVAQMSLELVAGWQVVAVSSGMAGVEEAQRHAPDVILLDVMMPVLDGPATLSRLRELPELVDVPILFLTAKTMTDEVERLKHLGARDVIAKPFDPMTLHEQIAASLGW